jgi:hypothetical protein
MDQLVGGSIILARPPGCSLKYWAAAVVIGCMLPGQ